jgi:transcriptional regulator with XRE-family HTH domain
VRKLDADRAIKDIGRRIAEIRRERGLTQEQTAERLGLQTNNLQRIELGMQNLTVRSLVRIANGLGVGLASLCEPPSSRLVGRGRPRRSS